MSREFDTSQTLYVFKQIHALLKTGEFPPTEQQHLQEVMQYVEAGLQALSLELMNEQKRTSTLQ